MCSINQADGSLTNCSDSGAAGLNQPTRIWLDNTNTHAYIYNFGYQTDAPITVCSISGAKTFINCSNLSSTMLHGLGLYPEPLYFNRYINRLVFYSVAYPGQFTTIGYVDGILAFSQEPGDGTLNTTGNNFNPGPGILTTKALY